MNLRKLSDSTYLTSNRLEATTTLPQGDIDVAQRWGALRVPHHENALEKLIAATAVIHELTVVTRNAAHFQDTGAHALNPFTA